jgi:hypothetical protein
MFHCAPKAPDPLPPWLGAGGLRFSVTGVAAFAAGHNGKAVVRATDPPHLLRRRNSPRNIPAAA